MMATRSGEQHLRCIVRVSSACKQSGPFYCCCVTIKAQLLVVKSVHVSTVSAGGE